MKNLAYALESTFWKEAVYEKDWKKALDELIRSLRDVLIFDNLAIFLAEKDERNSEVAYARAVGREKDAEADANWGETIANQVIKKGEPILKIPSAENETKKRIENAFLLGYPLKASGKLLGAFCIIRFGGPAYTQKDQDIISLAAVIIAYVFEKRALQKSIQELEEAQRQIRLQDDFVSTISHELRTPLGFIKGYSTTLLREDTHWDESTRREFLTIIDEESDHLTELIENLLESARIESETIEMNFQPIRLDALLRDVITRIHARYKNLQVSFDTECTKIVQGDGTKLAQVFENLFSNAVKYAPGSQIKLKLHKISPTCIEIDFIDNGQGIPKKYLPFIFDRFYRVPSSQGKTGTGLGLYISKRIIEAHHGKIWAESQTGEGTRFIIRLPAQT